MEFYSKSDQNNKKFWLPLDNAAKIFPAITTDELTSVFRISVVLKQAVRIKHLFSAVRSVEARFPYYKVEMKEGFFWYYLESADFLTPVEIDNQIPCRGFNKSVNLFRVSAYKNRISVEFSHVLTDGSGAFEFLKTLLVAYFELLGIRVPASFQYLKPTEAPNPEEFEDSYIRYFNEEIPASGRGRKAFHLPGAIRSSPRLEVLNMIVSTKAVKEKAAEMGVSITVYLIAVYLFVLQGIYNNLSAKSRFRRFKKLCVEVPVNLRNIYPSVTMRNFSLFVMPEIDLRLGHYTFDEIVKTVFHQMQLETDEKLVNKIIARHVGGERKILVRSVPLFVKSLIMRKFYFTLGCSLFSGVLTNLGARSFTNEINEQIEHLSFTPPPPNRMNKANCGVISFNDKLVLSFGSICKDRELEKGFANFFIGQGIHVKLTS